MDILIAKTIVGVAGCLSIAIACYATKSGVPLWALILLGLMLEGSWT